MRTSWVALLATALVSYAPPSPVAANAPATVVVATKRGEVALGVRMHQGYPALAAGPLAQLLPLTLAVDSGWATVSLAGQPFRFLLDAPVFVYRDETVPMVAGAFVADDTLYLPLEWVVGYLPRYFPEAYQYDPLGARLEETAVIPVVASVTPPPPDAVVPVAAAPPAGVPVAAPPAKVPAAAPAEPPVSDAARKNGLKRSHTVVVDAGHGGPDGGNPGYFFPSRVLEKDVTLAIAKDVQRALEQRGVTVIMTRSTDTLIALGDRAQYCRDDCDLFVSIHVNSVDTKHRGFERANGFETYYLALQARSAEARRVASMENEALRYDTPVARANDDRLGFILKDLQFNEYLRESAVLANFIQQEGAAVLPGGDHGISQAHFVVLTTAHRPAVLVETGFATNRADGQFLTSTSGQRKLGTAIAEGVVAYLRQYEEKVSDYVGGGNP